MMHTVSFEELDDWARQRGGLLAQSVFFAAEDFGDEGGKCHAGDLAVVSRPTSGMMCG